MVGDWVFRTLGSETLMKFKNDGTYTSSFVHKGAKVTQSGTYAVTGSWLHILPDKVVTDNAQLQAIYDREHLGRLVLRTKWEGENRVRLRQDGSKATQLMTRISEDTK